MDILGRGYENIKKISQGHKESLLKKKLFPAEVLIFSWAGFNFFLPRKK